MKRFFPFLLTSGLLFLLVACQEKESTPFIEIKVLNSGVEASFRGIASTGSEEVWVSGTQGTVLHSKDRGQTWARLSLPDADSLDFRDIEILDEQTILIMSIGNGQNSRVYKSNDSGQNWRTVLINQKETAFFNGFDFSDAQTGALVSDPIDGKLYLLKTENGGESWNRIGARSLPNLNATEYGFAASGTGVVTQGKNNIWIATGGDKARIFHSSNGGNSWVVFPTPMASGNASSGIFSISFRDSLNGIAVGGDYENPEANVVSLIRTQDGGKTWETIRQEPAIGHKACVLSLGEGLYLATGRTGVIWSNDDGLNWEKISADPYYTICFDETSKVGYMAGPEGRIARFKLKYQ